MGDGRRAPRLGGRRLRAPVVYTRGKGGYRVFLDEEHYDQGTGGQTQPRRCIKELRVIR